MPIKLLVLHGPNVPLRLEREESLPLTGLHRTLNQRARALGATLRFVHAHGEEGLTAALWEQRKWADGLLLAAGTASDSAVLREALDVLALPTVELLLGGDAPRKREAGGRLMRVSGRGEAAYLEGLERLSSAVGAAAGNVAEQGPVATASGTTRGPKSREPEREPKPAAGSRTRAAPAATTTTGADDRARAPGRPGPDARQTPAAAKPQVTKTLGRSATPPAKAPGAAKTLGRRKVAGGSEAGSGGKSLGRKGSNAVAGGSSTGNTDPTRAEARSQLAARLSGALAPAELSAWARRGWARFEADSARDPQLADVLLSLVATPKVTDERLVELMAELGS